MKKFKCLVCKKKETTKCGLFCKKCLKEADVFTRINSHYKSGRSGKSEYTVTAKYGSKVMQRFEEEKKIAEDALESDFKHLGKEDEE